MRANKSASLRLPSTVSLGVWIAKKGSPVRGHSGQRHSGLRHKFQRGECDFYQHTALHLVMTPLVRVVWKFENPGGVR